jgi:hypothetical protein
VPRGIEGWRGGRRGMEREKRGAAGKEGGRKGGRERERRGGREEEIERER